MSFLITGISHYNVQLFYFINRGMDNSFLDFLMPFLTDFEV